ncbi:flavin-containing monooxygenase [Catenuloplanes japonicus]|uniref:flavin-containing monooxygenase n=1 Tax=Catenuloplanes japonicus TaxID=33876 RepID=UPI00068BEA58|nr:NAD(P)/FAD-dependent oxidoreductase [Catenuloplanes japonicus]
MNVETWLASFEAALRNRDIPAVTGLFAAESYWRDLVAFTWNLATVEGRDGVAALLARTLDGTDPSGFVLTDPPVETGELAEGWFRFRTAAGNGIGHLRLAGGKAFTLLTTLRELRGFEEVRPDLDRRDTPADEPYVLVVGGGQGGIALGARLRNLGVPTVVAERHDRAGDSWRTRYDSLTLHDPVWNDHLPYLPFPSTWPVFSGKDRMADWLESYTRIMDVPYWPGATVRSARYDGGRWTVVVDRGGDEVVLRPAQLVFATGLAGKPEVPVLPGQDVFRGDQHHSSAHRATASYAGKRAVVVGSNNSAFDIAEALWRAGADVTMVQRSPTTVVRSATLMDVAIGDLYSEHAAVPTDRADLTVASLPYRIMHLAHIPRARMMAERDAEFYARLAKSGFRHDWGADGSGLVMKSLRRGSGFYVDTGAAELVIDGRIRLAHGQAGHLTEDALVLTDGTALPAGLIVYATGYRSMHERVAEIVDRETADRVGRVWGLGSDTPKDPGPWEGEQRNMWKPTRQPGLWFHGGNLHQSRHYSLYLALQLKARYEGLETPVYPPV